MSALNLDIPKKYRPYLRLGTCSWKYEGWEGLRYVVFQMAEVAIPRRLFATILRRISRLCPVPV